MISSLVLFCEIFVTLLYSVSCESCYYTNTYGRYSYQTCPGWLDRSDEYYCCGSGSSQYCCDYRSFRNNSGGTGIAQIIGGAISALFFVGVFVAIMICCCTASCPLYRRRQNWGRVHHIGQRQTVIVTSQQQQQQQQMHQMRPQVQPHHPQFVQQGPVMAPPYQYSGPQNPAYPPPSYQSNAYGMGQTNYGYPQGMPPPPAAHMGAPPIQHPPVAHTPQAQQQSTVTHVC